MTRARHTRWLTVLLAWLVAVAGCAAVWLAGCTNDPFDPSSIPNLPPVARVFVSPVEQDSLNPTSYYQRTFHWSGSDEDGFVVEYYISIETELGVAAPWDTTTRTDTTMTFITDDSGHAEANIHLACRDNRGAVSDTVTQYIPLRNFPPVMNYQADFDTVTWSYGAANFRFFALDLDGNETLDDSFRYKLDTADTTIVFSFDNPAADPAVGWVKKAYDDDQARTFTVALKGVAPAPERVLTVAVSDEALAEKRLDVRWEVMEAKSPVLLVSDASPFIDGVYFEVMDSVFGPGEWSGYDMLHAGLPDREWVLLETLRQFPVVLWYIGGSASFNLADATDVLTAYLFPSEPGMEPGKLLLVSKTATGAYTNLPPGFIQAIFGVSPTAAPPNAFYIPAGNQALGQATWLPDFTAENSFSGAVGVTLLNGTEALYQLEYCRNCYGNRPPFDPIVGVRRPERATDPVAQMVLLTLQLEYCVRSEVIAAMEAILTGEMGVVAP